MLRARTRTHVDWLRVGDEEDEVIRRAVATLERGGLGAWRSSSAVSASIGTASRCRGHASQARRSPSKGAAPRSPSAGWGEPRPQSSSSAQLGAVSNGSPPDRHKCRSRPTTAHRLQGGYGRRSSSPRQSASIAVRVPVAPQLTKAQPSPTRAVDGRADRFMPRCTSRPDRPDVPRTMPRMMRSRLRADPTQRGPLADQGATARIGRQIERAQPPHGSVMRPTGERVTPNHPHAEFRSHSPPVVRRRPRRARSGRGRDESWTSDHRRHDRRWDGAPARKATWRSTAPRSGYCGGEAAGIGAARIDRCRGKSSRPAHRPSFHSA